MNLRRRDLILGAATPSSLATSTLRLPKLYRVPLGFQSGRLHEMDPSYEDGCLWFWGRGGPEVICYDPATGQAERIEIPAPDAASAALLKLHFHPLSKNGKLHLTDLRQPTDRLPVYDIASRRTSFHRLPQGVGRLPVMLQNGIVSRVSPNVYLFVADPPGLIIWDSARQEGEFTRYPAEAQGPWGGVESQDGGTLWIPNPNDWALTRFDVRQRKWNGYWKSPFGKDSQPSAVGILGDVFYGPDLDEGRMLRFDTRREKWLRAVTVPGRGQVYGVLGGGAVYRGALYACLSTYRSYTPPGGPVGVDGKPYHFLDRYVCYEPRSRRLFSG